MKQVLGRFGHSLVWKPLQLLVFCLFGLVGCATVPTLHELNYTDGAAIATLSSSVSLAYASPDKSISGSGVIMYQKPGQFRIVILSPFGSVLQEISIQNQQITILDTGHKIAFTGNLSQIPEQSYFSGWKYIHWLVDNEIAMKSVGDKTVQRTGRNGELEKVVYVNGLVSEKSSDTGSSVKYQKYSVIQGIAVPLEILCETAGKDRLTVTFDEPEVNTPFARDMFVPKNYITGIPGRSSSN